MAHCYSGLDENSNEKLYNTYHINFPEDKFKYEEECKDLYLEDREFPRESSHYFCLYNIKLGVIRRPYTWAQMGQSRTGFYCRVCGTKSDHPRDIIDCHHTSYNDRYASYNDTSRGRSFLKEQDRKRSEAEYARRQKVSDLQQSRWENDLERSEHRQFARMRP